MLSFQTKIILIASLIFGGCSSSSLEEYRHIEFASCSWGIPSSYQLIGNINDNEFKFRKELYVSDATTKNILVEFNREKSTKDSFIPLKDLTKNFRMSESKEYLLVEYRILIRTTGQVIDEGRKIIVLVEKKTGHSVTLAALEIESVVSGCEIPIE